MRSKIENLLKKYKGFDNNLYSKKEVVVGEVIINGSRRNKTTTVEEQWKYIGEGTIDETVIYGYSVYINNDHMIDIWLEDEEDCKKMLNF